MFFDSELRSSVRILHGSENLGFRCRATPISMTLMPMFATYRVQMEQFFLFVKIANRYFEKKECFDSGSVKIKGAKTLHLSVVHSKHTAS